MHDLVALHWRRTAHTHTDTTVSTRKPFKLNELWSCQMFNGVFQWHCVCVVFVSLSEANDKLRKICSWGCLRDTHRIIHLYIDWILRTGLPWPFWTTNYRTRRCYSNCAILKVWHRRRMSFMLMSIPCSIIFNRLWNNNVIANHEIWISLLICKLWFNELVIYI